MHDTATNSISIATVYIRPLIQIRLWIKVKYKHGMLIDMLMWTES